MSKCQITTQILETECIGDSLAKINTNFSNLDRRLCDVPTLVPSSDVSINLSLPQEKSQAYFKANNSYSYLTNFDYTRDITPSTLSLADGTTISINEVIYNSVSGTPKPQGTFTVIAPNSKPPKVTLFWTGNGNNNLTTYALNSTVAGYNDSVNALYKDGDVLYVGGAFTTVNSITNRKLAALSAGSINFVEQTLAHPISSLKGDLEDTGSVYKIIKTVIGSSGSTFDGLVLVGSFNTLLNGRGLTILNITTKDTVPLYVNGVVHSAIVVGDPATSIGKNLYIVGDFDYLCKGSEDIEDQRIYTKGVAKISLSDLSAPNSIDEDFAQKMIALFDGAPVFNTIEQIKFGTQTLIVLGGNFRVVVNEEVVAQNLVAIDELGRKLVYWNPVVSGPVLTLKNDKDNAANGVYTNLYVGGMFDSYVDTLVGTVSKRNNAIAFTVYEYHPISEPIPFKLSNAWTPSFNGPVTSFDVDNLSHGYVYCYGNFTTVDGKDVAYLAGLKKEHVSGSNNLIENWRPKLQCAPEPINTSIIADTDNEAVIVGGNLHRVNSDKRIKLARFSSPLDTSVTPATGLKVNWEVGAQPLGGGMNLSFTDTPSVTASSYVEPLGFVTTTSFPPLTGQNKGFRQGQPYRFYIKRPGATGVADDDLKQTVSLIGWSIDFN
jgi:hypothetical protein